MQPSDRPAGDMWRSTVTTALERLENTKYTHNVDRIVALDNPYDGLLSDNSRAFVASREKTAHRKQRYEKMQETMDGIVRAKERVLTMGNDKGADWAVEAKNRRIDDFRNRQRKLALLSEDSPIIASRDEPLGLLSIHESVWPSSNMEEISALPMAIKPVIRAGQKVLKRFSCCMRRAGEGEDDPLSCIFLHMKELQLNPNHWSLDIKGRGHKVLKKICNVSSDDGYEMTFDDIIQVGDYLGVKVQIYDEYMNFLDGESFAGYPERCPLLFSLSEGWYLVRYVVGRCKNCGKPMVPDHTCIAKEVMYCKTEGLLESIRAEKEGVSFGGDGFDGPVLLGGGEKPEDRRTAVSIATRGTTRGSIGGLDGPPAHAIIRTEVRKGIPNHRDVSRYHLKDGVFVTQEEEMMERKERRVRKEERRKNRFLRKLEEMSPKNKDGKAGWGGGKKATKKKSRTKKKKKDSDKMEGFLSGMNGLLRLPNADSKEYENEMSWLFRNHCATSNKGSKKKKKKSLGGRFTRKVTRLEEMQATIKQKRQMDAQDKAYEKLMEEDAEKKFSYGGGGGFRASLVSRRYDGYRDFKGDRRRRSFGEVDVEGLEEG